MNDDLGGAFVRQAINASRGISFSARQLYEPSDTARVSARARKTILPIAKEELRHQIICATVVIIFQQRVKILRAQRCAKRAFSSKSFLSLFFFSFPSPLSLFFVSFFLFPSCLVAFTLYRQRGMLVVAGLTRRDFRTTKLRTPANVCKFAERISGLYCPSCNFY